MLRGLALAILLLNLALLLWGSSRPGLQRPVPPMGNQASPAPLPTLVLIDEVPGSVLLDVHDEVPRDPMGRMTVVSPCLRIGPLSADDTATLPERTAAWNLAWQRSDGREGSMLDVAPGVGAAWPESDLRALAEALATEISPCATADPIAPEPSTP